MEESQNKEGRRIPQKPPVTECAGTYKRRKRTVDIVTAQWLDGHQSAKCGLCGEPFEENDWIIKKDMVHLNCADETFQKTEFPDFDSDDVEVE